MPAETAPGKASPKPALHRYRSLMEAMAVGLVATIGALIVAPRFAVELGAIGFFLTYLVAILVRLPLLTPAHLRAHADESDVPGYLLLLIAIAAVVLSSASLFVLLNTNDVHDGLRLTLGILSVVLGWMGIHAMLAFHYAYEYYETDDGQPVGNDGKKARRGGLEFPGREAPDALSFLYFSFVVAMTAQVSDVVVTTNRMRATVLFHGILAFFFNTVVLATAVNIVVSLAH